MTNLANAASSNPAPPRGHVLTRWLFLRLLGLVYFIAFVSLWTQIIGLIGQHGILPTADFLNAVHQRFGAEAYRQFPTVSWFSTGDAFLHVQCGLGTLLSLLLLVGFGPKPLLVLLWVLYLSLVTVGQTFLSFQWDILLLETGLLAVFFAPWSLKLGLGSKPPSRLVLFLLRWLLFRLMLLSGLVKIWAGDATWTGLTALEVHYETQPLPTWTSWYVHHWPLGFHKFCVAVLFGIELGLPLLIFLGRRTRQVAAAGFVFLMLVVALTGNYNFFNLLTVTLCVTLLDDGALLRWVPRRFRAKIAEKLGAVAYVPLSPSTTTPSEAVSVSPPEDCGSSPRGKAPAVVWVRRGRVALVSIFTAFLVLQSLIAADDRLSRCPGYTSLVEPKRQWLRDTIPTVSQGVALGCDRMQRWIAPFHSVNAYGLFQSMTTTRPEIVIEGSNDAVQWLAYEFRWKPGDLAQAPRFVQPHQPRLDWQMWFAALRNFRSTPWFGRLMERLLEGQPEVLALLETNPFPDKPPRFLRAVLYRYRFSDPAAKKSTGQWWRREQITMYCPPITRRAK